MQAHVGKTELVDQVAFKSHLLIPWDLFWIPMVQAWAFIQPEFGESLNYKRDPNCGAVLGAHLQPHGGGFRQ